MMKQARRWVPVLVWILCWQFRSEAQGFRVDAAIDPRGDDSGYSTWWDSSQDRLILYRDTSAAAVPAARVFGKDGASVPVYPVRDLTGSWYMDTWGVAATPDGGVVFSAIVGYGARARGPGTPPPPVKSLLLTYNGAGILEKVWDVEPYHHHLVAADHDGNVFALGHRDDVAGASPLLVKYSPSGQVLREFLSSSLFSEGDAVVESGSPNGENHLFVKGDQLFLWVSRSQELLRFSLAGDLLGRISLAHALGDALAATGSQRTQVFFLTTTQKGEIIAQVSLWPKLKGAPVKFGMIRLSADGSQVTLIDRVAGFPTPGWFLGTTAEDKLVFFEFEPQGNAGVLREY